MSLLLQISDTHFGTERPDVVEALVRLARERRPEVLVLSGDITQRGTRRQYAAARAFVDRLGVAQRVVLPGNHDITLYNPLTRLLRPYAEHRRAFGHELEPAVDREDLLVLGVNTTRWWRHADGQVSARQVERVATRLAAARAGQLRVVVTHQPVAVNRAVDEHNLLHGRALALRRWREAGADLVLGGHIHLPFAMPLPAGAPTPSPAHPSANADADASPGQASLWAVQAGTAVSHRVRHEAGNSVNLVQVLATDAAASRRCEVQRWDYDGERGAFLPVDRRALAFGPHPTDGRP